MLLVEGNLVDTAIGATHYAVYPLRVWNVSGCVMIFHKTEKKPKLKSQTELDTIGYFVYNIGASVLLPSPSALFAAVKEAMEHVAPVVPAGL